MPPNERPVTTHRLLIARRVARAALLGLLGLSAPLLGHANGLPPSVRQALDAARLPLDAVSIVVQPLDSATPALRVNAEQPRNPASVAKLVTTLAALDQLGPAYTWTTALHTTSPAQDGVLAAPLYLKGSGDPGFTYERLWQTLRQLRERGVREIQGDLVLDRSIFAPVIANPGDFDGRPLRAYNALPDGLLFNYNAISLKLTPRAEGVEVLTQPRPDTLVVEPRVRLNPEAPCKDWRERLTLQTGNPGPVTRLMVGGDYPAACGERDLPVQALRATDLLAGSFRVLWRELGGSFSGAVREGVTPAEATPIAVSPAPTLAEAVRDTNKYSNNVLARQIYLTLGREFRARQGTLAPTTDEDGEAAVADWAARRGIALPGLRLVNGSGLARDGRVTAEGLAALLRYAWQSPVMPEFIASLPIVGTDGTMRRRALDSAAAGRAHIKSGLLDGVRSFAGYVLDAQGRRWLVVFLANHSNAAGAGEAMDALLAWVADGNARP